MPQRILNLSEISQRYDVILCDVWGVIHNGSQAFSQAITALEKARFSGCTVILLTNSPRPVSSVILDLDHKGIPHSAWDSVITSGEVTRKIIDNGPKKIFFLGPPKDYCLFSGLDVELVDEHHADIVICSDMYNDTDKPEDYRSLLTNFAERKLTFVCANPDLVVKKSDKTVACAGALAAIYSELQGTVKMAGKPYQPIYKQALLQAHAICGEFEKKRVLTIGDNMGTDVKGALDNGLDILYISNGIHMDEYTINGKINVEKMQAFFEKKSLYPHWWMPQLT
ncbi:hypothetical protein B488_02540 [Liberibacter crescens BT-1]|uniref:HAD superfamily protein involved in N-acetyl-glucosamine catabolism n=1 Tax=Liberibacter crescens (strain BT-1) TaxID=1215343 RepID=L0ETG4_LIBCB|nr:TIGR01459 family HAD-type hydrolase [Liberibacter crescens]AGA64247.1 hypothetical protein B488_02540 [Liberibacter crescens BT-1]AMC12486.1 HAD family hydrolase [Liberibacter crescens]